MTYFQLPLRVLEEEPREDPYAPVLVIVTPGNKGRGSVLMEALGVQEDPRQPPLQGPVKDRQSNPRMFL